MSGSNKEKKLEGGFDVGWSGLGWIEIGRNMPFNGGDLSQKKRIN